MQRVVEHEFLPNISKKQQSLEGGGGEGWDRRSLPKSDASDFEKEENGLISKQESKIMFGRQEKQYITRGRGNGIQLRVRRGNFGMAKIMAQKGERNPSRHHQGT